MIEEGCNYRQAFEQYVVEERGRRPSITEIGYTRLIIDAVIENLGVSLLPRIHAGGSIAGEKDCTVFRQGISKFDADAGYLQQKSLGIAGNESFYQDDERIYAGVISEKRVERE